MVTRVNAALTALGLFSILAAAAAPGLAASVVVPGGLATVEGNTNNRFPFGVEEMRYQQVYDATEFGSSPLLISAVAFRPDATHGEVTSRTFTDLDVRLSSMLSGGFPLSTTFATNVGSDETVVFSGTQTLSTSFTGPVGGPKAFDWIISFTTPFLYDPGAGNLLLDIRHASGSRTSGQSFSADANDSLGSPFIGSTSRMWSANANSATGTIDAPGRALGLVTQFTGTPVPEPTALSLFGLGLAGLALRRRRRRSAA